MDDQLVLQVRCRVYERVMVISDDGLVGGVSPLRTSLTELDTLVEESTDPLRCHGAFPKSLRVNLEPPISSLSNVVVLAVRDVVTGAMVCCLASSTWGLTRVSSSGMTSQTCFCPFSFHLVSSRKIRTFWCSLGLSLLSKPFFALLNKFGGFVPVHCGSSSATASGEGLADGGSSASRVLSDTGGV